MRISQENTIDRCRFCFMCRHVCSAARATQKESITPRSQGLVMSLINRDAAQADPDVIANIYNCTQCRWCKEWCEGGWDFSVCVIAAREAFLVENLVPQTVKERIRQLEQQSVTVDTTSDLLLLAEPTWVDGAKKQTKAAYALLKQAGHSVCASSAPSPVLALYLLGARAAAAQHLQQLIAAIQASGCRTVVAISPGDAFVLRELPGILETDALPEAIRVCSLADLLLETIQAGTLKPRPSATKWTYHDDDFSARYTHESAALPALLAAVPELTVASPVWKGSLARSSGGASMGCTDQAIIARLAALRVEELQKTGARHIVTMTADDAALLAGAGTAGMTVCTLTGFLATLL